MVCVSVRFENYCTNSDRNNIAQTHKITIHDISDELRTETPNLWTGFSILISVMLFGRHTVTFVNINNHHKRCIYMQ